MYSLHLQSVMWLSSNVNLSFGKLVLRIFTQILLERGASLESKDEDGAIPLHDACAGGTLSYLQSISCHFITRLLIFCELRNAGYTDIVQLLLNNANDADIVKRMLESVDVEGDTVSNFLFNCTWMHSYFLGQSLLRKCNVKLIWSSSTYHFFCRITCHIPSSSFIYPLN